MHKRMMQIAFLFGVLSIPTFASAEGGLLEATLKEPSEVSETVTEKVANTSSQVEEASALETDQKESIQPTTKIVETVNKTTQNITKSVVSEKPIVKANISTTPSIKVNEVEVKAEAEVLTTPKLTVDTPIAKAEASKDTVKVDAEVVKDDSGSSGVHVEAEINPQVPLIESEVDVEISNPSQSTKMEVVETVTTKTDGMKSPDVKANQESISSRDIGKVESERIKSLKIGEIQGKAMKDQSQSEFAFEGEITNVSPRSAKVVLYPIKEPTDFERLKVTPTFQPGPSTQTNAPATTSAAAIAVLNGIDVTSLNGYLAYFGKNRLFFNQWLNAPPSQPPQILSSTISRI